MKDTVTRITFLWVGLGRRVGGFRDPFGFLGFFFFFLAKNSVVFLCTRFCLKSRADDSLKKKRKKKGCAFVSCPEPCCVTVLALPRSKV